MTPDVKQIGDLPTENAQLGGRAGDVLLSRHAASVESDSKLP